jgi:hypothetical protein
LARNEALVNIPEPILFGNLKIHLEVVFGPTNCHPILPRCYVLRVFFMTTSSGWKPLRAGSFVRTAKVTLELPSQYRETGSMPHRFVVNPTEDGQKNIDPDSSTMSLDTLLNIHNILSVKAPILVPVIFTAAGAAHEPKVTRRVEAL